MVTKIEDPANKLGSDALLRRAISRALRKSKLSRTQVCDELGERVGVRISVHMLNAYTSESNRSARFPAAFIVPLCQVLGDDELQRCIIESRLRRVLELGEFVARLLEENVFEIHKRARR